jgi:chemotaxis protein CheC
MKNLGLADDVVDALLETANIGVGRAAANLSELTGREVEISVLELVIFSAESTVETSELQNVAVLRIAQRFTQAMEGYVMLLLNEAGARRVARLILGEQLEANSFDEIEQSALLELGNIMINGVMGTIANQLSVTLGYDVPYLELKGTAGLGELIFDLIPNRTTQVVFMRASLKISEEVIHGYIVLILDQKNLEILISKLSESM